MGSFSIWHWIIVLSVISVVVPAWRILGRLGISPLWSLLYFLPFGGLVGVWVLAYARWPATHVAAKP